MNRLLLSLLLSLCLCPVALAWSDLGHRLVGELAERRLSPQAREQVHTLLAGEAEPTLAGVASWADEIRDQPQWRQTSPLHYVNIRDAACHYEAARDCRNGECVVAAIVLHAQRLADTGLSREERALALKFLVHFVGDVHQPLHSGHRPDKGGNDFQVSLRWREPYPWGINLHSVWDYFVLASADLDQAAYAERLAAIMPAPSHAGIDPGHDTPGWAENSCTLTNSEGFYPRRPGKLPPGYLERQRPLAEARLQLAAARLAQLIEQALAPTH
jgi:hypothetical protein